MRQCDRYFVQNPFNPTSLLCKFALVFTELLSKHSNVVFAQLDQ